MQSPQGDAAVAASAAGQSLPARIWPSLTADDRATLHSWMSRGRPFGLLDVEVVDGGRAHPCRTRITIWVRESADPAYLIHLNGRFWQFTDLHGSTASRESFLDVLNAIRRIPDRLTGKLACPARLAAGVTAWTGRRL